jgi:endonuclease YncB( thermonuclease family)
MIVYAITAGRHHRRGRGLLHGIDAPEVDQTFWWRSQRAARLSLAEALTAGVTVRCKEVERDRHGRIVAKVFAPDGVDISRRLVSAGWALAYRRYSMDYIDAEDEAREARRGMWRGSFMKPWVWRASQGTQAPSRVVPISRHGR